jgi:hypothetical protein
MSLSETMGADDVSDSGEMGDSGEMASQMASHMLSQDPDALSVTMELKETSDSGDLVLLERGRSEGEERLFESEHCSDSNKN